MSVAVNMIGHTRERNKSWCLLTLLALLATIVNHSQPSGRLLLSTLVDITSCNDFIKTAALRCQN